MTTARQFLDLLRRFELFEAATADPQAALAKLTDEQCKTAILLVAEQLKMLKQEAVRRGIWDELKGQKVG